MNIQDRQLPEIYSYSSAYDLLVKEANNNAAVTADANADDSLCSYVY